MPQGQSSVIIRPSRTNTESIAVTDTIFSDTPWHSPEATTLPPDIDQWLLDPGSLTTKLRQHTSAFNVRVLHHGPGLLSEDERELLDQYADGAQVREVLLCAGTTPWVFARSLIPATGTASSTLTQLQSIGNKPLGEALFNTPAVRRGPFQVSCFSQSSRIATLDHTHAVNKVSAGTLWGRRRIFWVGSIPVLVAEVFLRQAPCYR